MFLTLSHADALGLCGPLTPVCVGAVKHLAARQVPAVISGSVAATSTYIQTKSWTKAVQSGGISYLVGSVNPLLGLNNTVTSTIASDLRLA